MVSNVSSSSTNSLASTLWSQLQQSDTDNDGKLSKTEMEAGSAKLTATYGSNADFSKVFSKIDTDGDGYITQDEFNNYMQNSSASNSIMGGMISSQASQAIQNMQSQMISTLTSGSTSDSSNTNLFSQLDTNQDGKISQSDFSQIGSTLLNQLQSYNSALASNSNLDSMLGNSSSSN